MKQISLMIFLSFVCYSGLRAQQRVTGGNQINISAAPWQVLLREGSRYTCGGSIIASNYILTAKHCINGVAANNLKIIAGVTCKNEVNSSNTFDVAAIIPHPTLDVALLRLSSNISYNTNRRVVNYLNSTTTSLYNAGNTVSVSGWGWLTSNGYELSNCLNAVNLHIISNQDATLALDSTVNDNEVSCTGVGNVRQGACHGDSGGPLVTWSNALNEYVLIGVVGWGRTNCTGTNANSPSIFIRVSSIVNWINSNIYSISGPARMCVGSSATFTVSNPPSGGYTWTCSSNLTAGAISGNSRTFTATTVGSGWVAINYNGIELTRLNIQVMASLPMPVSTDYSATMSTTYNGFLAEATVVNGNSGIDQYSWSIFNANNGSTVTNSGWSISAYNSESGKPSMHRVLVTGGSPSNSSGLRLRVCAHNCAGWGECLPLGNLSNGSYSFFSASPNPASNLLNIEIEATQPATSNATPIQQASSTGNASPIALPQQPVYEVKIFNTATGAMVYQQTMKGKSKQIDVSGLPNGIYTLNISDGSGNPPMTQQIVVAH